MAGTTTVAAQSTFANVQEAINHVRVLVGNDSILREGQFAWANMYSRALRHKVETLVPSTHPLHTPVLGGDSPLLNRILVTCIDRDIDEYQKVWRKINAVVEPYHRAHPNDAGANWLLQLLTRSSKEEGGANKAGKAGKAHDAATGAFARGHNFAEGSREKQVFCSDVLHGFAICFDMYAYAAQVCATLAVVLVKYLYANGWRDNQRLRSAAPSPIDYFREKVDTDDELDPQGTRSRGTGQIIGFSPRLTDNVRNARLALNRGYLLTTRVISGIRKDHGPPEQESEHSLTIIGQESNGQSVSFGFWDPDATTSTGDFPEAGFGLLHYAGAGACRECKFSSQHKYGRLTTARDDSDLVVNRAGYHVAPSPGVRHRYQCISMAYG